MGFNRSLLRRVESNENVIEPPADGAMLFDPSLAWKGYENGNSLRSIFGFRLEPVSLIAPI